jgi:hypothetical protein
MYCGKIHQITYRSIKLQTKNTLLLNFFREPPDRCCEPQGVRESQVRNHCLIRKSVFYKTWEQRSQYVCCGAKDERLAIRDVVPPL